MPSVGITDMKYPYIASEKRAHYIVTQFHKVKIGDAEKAVVAIMSEPDEITDLFEPVKDKPKVIGKSYWYIIQRISENGSVNDKQEKLVRISFDIHGLVNKVDNWGF